MATTVTLEKEVKPGLSQYVGLSEITAINDIVEMKFDKPIQIEQLTINTSLSYKVFVVYPGSDLELTVLNTVGDRSINSKDNSNRGQMWYRLPANSKVKLEIDATPSTEVLSMTILGRSL